MIEPFKRAEVPGIGPEGYFIPQANPEAEWFFNEPTVATREYKGKLLRLTETGWEFYVQGKAFSQVGEFTLTDPVHGWHPVYPKVSYLRQALQVLQNTWSERNSPYKYVQQFEDAECPFTDEYKLGEYWLVEDDPWYLVPVNKAEQLSNINELEFYRWTKNAPSRVDEVFYAVQEALAPMRNEIFGVIFTSENGRRASVRVNDFDWKAYDSGRDGNREPEPFTE